MPLVLSWDRIYQGEKANFEDIGDEGEVWYTFLHSTMNLQTHRNLIRFGESSRDKMVQWALTHAPPSPASSLDSPSILEVGFGNGDLLFALASAGYPPTRLAGIDYSPHSVILALSIAESRGPEFKNIMFAEADFLNDKERRTGMPRVEGMKSGEGWVVVMDKGTYDAIALSESVDDEGKRVYKKYPGRIAEILQPGGYFLITCEPPLYSLVSDASITWISMQLQQGRAHPSLCHSRNETRISVSDLSTSFPAASLIPDFAAPKSSIRSTHSAVLQVANTVQWRSKNLK